MGPNSLWAFAQPFFDPTGTAFAFWLGFEGVFPRVRIYRSSDAGLTWGMRSPPVSYIHTYPRFGPRGVNIPTLGVPSKDTVLTAWLDDIGNPRHAGIIIGRSIDGGVSLIPKDTLIPPVGMRYQAQTMASANGWTLLAFYQYDSFLNQTSVMATVSSDRGNSWSPLSKITQMWAMETLWV